MFNKQTIFQAFAGSLIITLLFHRQEFGLNVLLVNTVLLIWLLLRKELSFGNSNHRLYGLLLLVTSVAVVVTYSVFAQVMYFVSLFIFIGVLVYPQAKSVISSVNLSFLNLVTSQTGFFSTLTKAGETAALPKRRMRKRIFIIPLLIIIFFVIIYRGANPIFDRFAGNITSFIGKQLEFIFGDFDFLVIFTFFAGFFISNFIFFRNADNGIIKDDLASEDTISRMRKKKNFPFRFTALRNEVKAGIFLLVVLNLILLAVNSIDIYWVWFNFSWNGQTLKQFVHEGTYLLIFSILCSIAIVLYFFRKNLNFYRDNRLLKNLSYIWLVQNAILTLSVVVRNIRYVDYFALAYKRIGLFIFLILTFYGLYTVLIKVRDKKSSFYLFRKNTFAVYLILVVSSLVNWDSLIAKYNFGHSDSAFLHLNYLSSFSDKALPFLDKPLEELKQTDMIQKEKFPFDEKFMTPEVYHSTIENRKKRFLENWEKKSILSWNLPEYMAYKKLK